MNDVRTHNGRVSGTGCSSCCFGHQCFATNHSDHAVLGSRRQNGPTLCRLFKAWNLASFSGAADFMRNWCLHLMLLIMLPCGSRTKNVRFEVMIHWKRSCACGCWACGAKEDAISSECSLTVAARRQRRPKFCIALTLLQRTSSTAFKSPELTSSRVVGNVATISRSLAMSLQSRVAAPGQRSAAFVGVCDAAAHCPPESGCARTACLGW